MVWKDYQHPLSIDCANEIDAIISKSRLQWWKMRQKKIIFWTLRLGEKKKKKKEKGVKLKDEKKKGKACSHAPSRISEPSLHSLLFYVITWCDNLQIRHRPTCAHCMIWYWLSSCICEQHLLSEGAGISMLS